MTAYRFSFPTLIHFGAGVRSQIRDHLLGQGLKRPLIVTDRGLAALPLLKELEKGLASGGALAVATFSGVHGNPVESQVTEGVRAYREHRADSIVGVGSKSRLACQAKVLGTENVTIELLGFGSGL